MQFRLRRNSILFLTILLLVGRTSQADEQSQKPNFLFILTDDQRPDTIAALGNDIIQTPNMDRLVKQGLSFTRATCAYPICTPSRAEILTGASGFKNGIFSFGGQFKPDVSFWPETMKRGGYRTGYVGKWHVRKRPHLIGYDESPGLFGAGGKVSRDLPLLFPNDYKGAPVTGYRGWIFQTSENRNAIPAKGTGLTPEISSRFADASIEFLKEKSNKPYFLCVNFTSPHDPLLIEDTFRKMYDPEKIPLPENFLPGHPFQHGNLKGRDEILLPFPRTEKMIRRELAAYYAVISYMDQQIGRILDYLEKSGQMNNTVIIFSSDHGLAMGSHGLRGKQNMYDHTIGVPLVMVGPGIRKGERTAAQCYLRDLYPTICDMAGIPVPESVEGKSLLPVIQGTQDQIYSHVFGYYFNYQRMIRSEDWKLNVYPHIGKSQLFHLKEDPNELHDLSGDPRYASVLDDLQGKLTSWQKTINDPALKVKKK